MGGLKGQLGQLFLEALKPIVSALGTRVEGCLVWARRQAQKRGLVNCVTVVGTHLQAVTPDDKDKGPVWDYES